MFFKELYSFSSFFNFCDSCKGRIQRHSLFLDIIQNQLSQHDLLKGLFFAQLVVLAPLLKIS